MVRPLLPPRGVFIPTRMIYNLQLPPAAILTWIQLRGLAWDGTVTPPLRMQELAALTGKCRATIFGHMSRLRDMAALSWRTTEQGTIIVWFAGKPSDIFNDLEPNHPPPRSQNPESKTLDSSHPPSSSSVPGFDSGLIPARIQTIENNLGDGGGEEGAQIQKSGLDSRNLEHDDPVSAYTSLIHLTPNASQRRLLAIRVTDLALWQSTLEHWISHGWNPRNLTGMLDLYSRGGPSTCRKCSQSYSHSSPAETPLDHTLAVIAALRDKQHQPPPDE